MATSDHHTKKYNAGSTTNDPCLEISDDEIFSLWRPNKECKHRKAYVNICQFTPSMLTRKETILSYYTIGDKQP